MKTQYTKETGIEIKKIANNHWQHIDTNTSEDSQVGPIYRTKTEALADHEAYLKQNWGLKY